MAVVEISARDRASRAATFIAKATTTERKSFRLPPSRIAELRTLFVDLETMMGHKGQAYEHDSPTVTSGGLDSDVVGVSLSSPEQWCSLSRRQKSGLAKAYRTLTRIAKTEWWTLWRAYGPRSPNMIATADFTAELAPLALLTDVVEDRRAAMRDAVIEARLEKAAKAASIAHADMTDAFRVCAWDKTNRAIRAGADMEVSQVSALDSALHVKETGDAKAREAIREQRKSFVHKVARQADRMLADSSMAFQRAWWQA